MGCLFNITIKQLSVCMSANGYSEKGVQIQGGLTICTSLWQFRMYVINVFKRHVTAKYRAQNQTDACVYPAANTVCYE